MKFYFLSLFLCLSIWSRDTDIQYRIHSFDSWDAAIEGVLETTNNEFQRTQFIPPTDDNYIEINELLDRIYLSLEEIKGELSFPKPMLLLVNSPDSIANAGLGGFIEFIDSEKLITYVGNIITISRNIPHHNIPGLLAHEIGHIYEKSIKQNASIGHQREDFYYLNDNSRQPISEEHFILIRNWSIWRESLGNYRSNNTTDLILPMDTFLRENDRRQYARLLLGLIEQIIETNQCPHDLDDLREERDLSLLLAVRYESQWGEERIVIDEDLRNSERALEQAINECVHLIEYKPLEDSLLDEYPDVPKEFLSNYYSNASDYERNAWERVQEIFNQSENSYEGLRNIMAYFYERVAEYEEELGNRLYQIRHNTSEDFADRIGIEILQNISIGANSLNQFLIRNIADTECMAQLDRNEEPAYGTLIINEHHSSCWRAWRNQNLWDHLNQ